MWGFGSGFGGTMQDPGRLCGDCIGVIYGLRNLFSKNGEPNMKEGAK